MERLCRHNIQSELASGLPERKRRSETIASGDHACVPGFDVPEDADIISFSDMSHPLYVVDISEPDRPRLVATAEGVTGLPPWQSIVATEETVFVTNNRTLHLVDLHAGQ